MNIIGEIRVNEATGEGSIIDLIWLVCPGRSEDHPSKALARVIARDDGDHLESGEGETDAVFVRGRISQSVHRIPINGTGNETPVGDAKTRRDYVAASDGCHQGVQAPVSRDNHARARRRQSQVRTPGDDARVR
ncbi:unnamed protein product [Laminaria digitata]